MEATGIVSRIKVVFVLLPTLGILAGALPAVHAAPGDVIWVGRGDIRSIPVSVLVSPGADTVFATDELFGVVAYDAVTGALRWQGRWGRRNDNGSRSSALSTDGSTIYATGHAPSHPGEAYSTVAYDSATGRRLWVSRQFVGGGYNVALSIAVSPDGELVFVTGVTDDFRIATVAYEASTGDMFWVSSTRKRAFVKQLVVDPGGERLYVTGSVGYPKDLLTVAYATRDGEELWRNRYEARRPSFSTAASVIAVDAHGSSVFVTGSITPRRKADDSRFLTIGYDAVTGDTRWSHALNPTPDDYDYAADVVVDSEAGRVIVTGASAEDISTFAYDAASGARLWLATYDVEGPYGEPNDMSINPAMGDIYVLGTVWGAGTNDWDNFVLIKYDAAIGAQEWLVPWGVVGERDQADAVAIDPGGERVYVAGSSSDGEGSYDTVVIAFSTE